MDASTPLWKAHDISQQLQDTIEVLPNVERAFVHVDHETTHTPVGPFTSVATLRPPVFSLSHDSRTGTSQVPIVAGEQIIRVITSIFK